MMGETASISRHEAYAVAMPHAVVDLVRTSARRTPADAAWDAMPEVVPGAILCDANTQTAGSTRPTR